MPHLLMWLSLILEIALAFIPTEKKPQQAAKAIKGGALLRYRPKLSFDPVTGDVY